MLRRSVATALLVLTVTGCSASTEADSQAESEPKTSEQEVTENDYPEVPWSDYAPVVKQQIDRLAAKGKCSGLQEQFDAADANSEATMARTGHNNADLMDYIDAQMQEAGCY